MKIDNNRANFDAIGTVKNDDQANATKGAGRAESAAGADKVKFSDDLQFAKAVIRAATLSPDVRPEVVARAKALLETGRLGGDPHKLADALIDKTIDNS